MLMLIRGVSDSQQHYTVRESDELAQERTSFCPPTIHSNLLNFSHVFSSLVDELPLRICACDADFISAFSRHATTVLRHQFSMVIRSIHEHTAHYFILFLDDHFSLSNYFNSFLCPSRENVRISSLTLSYSNIISHGRYVVIESSGIVVVASLAIPSRFLPTATFKVLENYHRANEKSVSDGSKVQKLTAYCPLSFHMQFNLQKRDATCELSHA